MIACFHILQSCCNSIYLCRCTLGSSGSLRIWKFSILREQIILPSLFKLSAVKLTWTIASEYLLKQVESNPSVFRRIYLLLVVDVASFPFGPLFSWGSEVLFRTACCSTEELQVEALHMATINPKSNLLLYHFCSYASA